MTRFSFQKLDDDTWGVKASGNLDQADRYAGETVTVTKRDGTPQDVQLGAMIDRWNGGRAATYAVRGVRDTSARNYRGSSVAKAMDDYRRVEEDQVDADDQAEAEYDDMAADAYNASTPAAQLQKALAQAIVERKSLYRLAESFPVTDAQLADADAKVAAAQAETVR